MFENRSQISTARLIQRIALFSRHPSMTEIGILFVSRHIPATICERVFDALSIKIMLISKLKEIFRKIKQFYKNLKHHNKKKLCKNFS